MTQPTRPDRSALPELGELLADTAAAAAVIPPPHLRRRVLETALARRPAVPVAPASPVAVHRLEAARFGALLDSLTSEEWSRPVGPIEPGGVADWSVRELVAHVMAVEIDLARALGVDRPGAKPTSTAPTWLVELWFALAREIDTTARGLGADDLDQPVPWAGAELPVAGVLLDRAFEIWIHADDIRAAVGRPPSPPPSPSLAAMSSFAVSLLPTMFAVADSPTPPGTVAFELTGPGGGLHEVCFDSGDARTVIETDVVAFCRAVGHRLDDEGLPHRHDGDAEVAARVVAVLPALARL